MVRNDIQYENNYWKDYSKESLIEKDYKPFWDDFCGIISSNLLSHIHIDSADLETCLSKQENKSWFSIENKFHKIKDS